MSRLISHKPYSGNQYIRTSPGRDPISPKRTTNRLLIKNSARTETDAHEYKNRQSLGQSNSRQNTYQQMERMDSGENELYEAQHDGGSRLRDLCASDKKKVGELMKKLASEKEEKQILQQQLLLKDRNYEKTISQLKQESQDYFKGSLELQEDLKSSLNLLKSVGNISSTKERQQKLFSSLISNKDQSSRSYNYRDNPLIAQKENVFQNSNYSSPGGGLASYYKDKSGMSMTTLPTQTANKKKFLELEAELDLLERKNKAYKTMENFELNNENNQNQFLTPDYHHFKAQKIQESQRQENPLYSPNQKKHYKTLQSPVRPSYEELPSNDRLSSQNARNSFGKLRNATKSYNDPSSISRQTTEEKTLDLDYRPVYQKPQRDTSNDDDHHHMPLKAKPMSSTENYMPSSANHIKAEEDFSLAKAQTEPLRKKGSEALVDIGTMSVKQLIELKNIIDERIEIEELKDKRYKFKTSPQRNIQRAEQIVRSPENQKYSMNKSMGRFSQETQKKSDNQRRSDGFQQNQTQPKLKKNNSQTQTDLKENLQPRSTKIEYIETDESEMLRSSNKEAIGKLYDQKLQEFLQVRDMMFKLQETSSAEIEEVPKVLEIKTAPQQPPKKDETLLASPRLFTFTSPMNMTAATPVGDLPALSAKDLLPSPMGMEKVMMRQEKKPEAFIKSSDRDRNSHQLTRDDSDSRFSFAEKAQSKGEAKVYPTLASEPTSANLMKHTEILKYSDPLNERNTPETNAVLMKIKEMLETTPNNSQVDISKEDLMKRYSSLSQAAIERGSAQLSKREFSLLQDSTQMLDTPTLFANYDLQINSRMDSSTIETDLSILAINKRIDELKNDNLTSSRSRHY